MALVLYAPVADDLDEPAPVALAVELEGGGPSDSSGGRELRLAFLGDACGNARFVLSCGVDHREARTLLLISAQAPQVSSAPVKCSMGSDRNSQDGILTG
jgi:hypothetical protein